MGLIINSVGNEWEAPEKSFSLLLSAGKIPIGLIYLQICQIYGLAFIILAFRK